MNDSLVVLEVFVLSIILSCLAFFVYEFREKRKSQVQLIQYKRRTAREGIVDFGISREEADQVTRLCTSHILDTVKSHQLSVEKVVRSFCQRCRWAASLTSCLTNELFLEAILEAKSLDAHLQETGQTKGPLHGLTFSVKDNIDVKGSDSTMGLICRCFRSAEEDATVVSVLKTAGAIVICKTNVPTTLLTPYETVNPIFGETKNPWSTIRVPGGSSGGAAVLARLYGAHFHLGTDIGGSLRAPAHFCGVCSLKPTCGRLPSRGEASINPGQIGLESTIGFMSCDVNTLALILKTLSDPRWWNSKVDRGLSPPLPFDEALYNSSSMLRIGIIHYDGWLVPHPSIERALQHVSRLLKEKGHRVIDWTLPVDQWEVIAIFSSIMTSDDMEMIRRAIAGIEPSSFSKSLLSRNGKLNSFSLSSFFGMRNNNPSQEKDRFISEMLLLSCVPRIVRKILAFALEHIFGSKKAAHILRSFGCCQKVIELERVVARQRALREQFVDAMSRDRLDAVILPTCAIPAGRSCISGFRVLAAFSYCFLCNVLNIPAGVVPITLVNEEEGRNAWLEPCSDLLEREVQNCVVADNISCEGLPVGLQVVSYPWREETCLRVMREMEELAKAQK
ncbi:amidase [Galdieria sulphuraria]|uniref:Amidase n=1 Tax=Galdieria sulphuraria TaxID=130081 RepID=M2WUN7_GALSU|nr:amidase [Galdieria sulphuraria]EME27675.1 amidase [Galdieria sulphuraria]|eukprot:XP_005704195.1 amidase [Galdieria sulphuraria]